MKGFIVRFNVNDNKIVSQRFCARSYSRKYRGKAEFDCGRWIGTFDIVPRMIGIVKKDIAFANGTCETCVGNIEMPSLAGFSCIHSYCRSIGFLQIRLSPETIFHLRWIIAFNGSLIIYNRGGDLISEVIRS